MSSTSNDWRSPKTTDNDYWELQYLKTLKPEWFKRCALICGGIAFLLFGALEIIVLEIGWPHWSVTALVILNTAAAVVLCVASVVQLIYLKAAIDHDDREGRLARRPLAEELRSFALKQEHDFGFLLTIKGWHPDYGDARQEWALDHARQIREKWPTDFEEYRKLQADVNYNRARSDIFDRRGSAYGEGTLLFEQILESRQDMRDRVGRSLKKDRAVTAIDRETTISTHDELSAAQVQGLADRLKKKPDEDDDD